MDPQVEALLQMMQAQARAAGQRPLHELSPQEARQQAELAFAAFNQPLPTSVSVSDLTLPGPAGLLRAKLFRPQGEGTLPLLVYFHGGGWVIGSPETHAKLCAELAEGAGCLVLSVDYRLAPEHPAPAPLDDCTAAVRWAFANAAALGADASRIAVGGDSAGANLAAAACLRLRDGGGPLPRFQLLLYGVFQRKLDSPSMIENAEGKILTREAMAWFWNHYLSGGASDTDPYVAPVHGDLRGLPPAFLIVGTLDPLLDDSRAYAAKLEAAGVPVKLSIYEDQPHIFLQLTALLDRAKEGLSETCAALREGLAA
ncbi:Carboxylesterase NlhH [bacterium HR29]|jgi:acetyl esterase|nr:Carboxylesterase NlhH [bacterium HR29]